MYERCGTFAPSPMSAFFVSTKVPTWASAARCVPARSDTYGPTVAPSPITDSRATVCWTTARSCTTVSTSRVPGPITAPRPIVVRPSRIVPGSRRTSGASSTIVSMKVLVGSTIVTPSIIHRSLMRSRSTASAVASWARSFTWQGRRVLGRDRDHRVTGLAQHGDGVGQVVLALRVLGAQAPQCRREQAAAEAVDRRVDLGQVELVCSGVGPFDDAVHPTLGIAHDAAEA